MAEAAEAKPRRKIKLETRHGSSRESRSRKDRPCDVCRGRKSACVITVKPPCQCNDCDECQMLSRLVGRFCEIRGVECTFTSSPRPRRRDGAPSDGNATKPSPSTPAESGDERALESESPQASRFPITSMSTNHGSSSTSISSPHSTTQSIPDKPSRQYLSLQQLTSPSHDTSSHSSTYPTTRLNQPQRPLTHNHLSEDRTQYSLEHGKNVTAHFVGLAGEQDTNLFASIRYNILNETRFIDFNITQVYAGEATLGLPPIHFTVISDTFPERDQRVKRLASDAIEAIVGNHGDALIRLYFHFIHPAIPVLSKAGFLAMYSTSKLSIPASLRGAIYGLAIAFWSQDQLLASLPTLSQTQIMDHTHAALNRELESPKLATLQACLLALHEQPDVNGTTESPRIWVLACQATACAQSLGLHQDPTNWKLPTWEKHLRKRLWWATVAGDTWTSICHGQTPHIAAGTYNTPSLDIEDLASDEDVTGVEEGEYILLEQDRGFNRNNAVSYIQAVELTRILAELLWSSFTLQSYHSTIQHLSPMERETSILSLKSRVEHTLASLPPSFHELSNANLFLHLGFFAVKFLIYRALMSPATSESKNDPTSRLRHYFDAAMAEAERFMLMMGKLKDMDLHVFWYRHSRMNLIHSTNFLIYLFFLCSSPLPLARLYTLLSLHHDILSHAIKRCDWSTIGLLRPSLLRTESFFANAAGAIEERRREG